MVDKISDDQPTSFPTTFQILQSCATRWCGTKQGTHDLTTCTKQGTHDLTTCTCSTHDLTTSLHAHVALTAEDGWIKAVEQWPSIVRNDLPPEDLEQAQAQTHRHRHTRVHTHARTHAHTHAHTHTHIHTHTRCHFLTSFGNKKLRDTF